MKGGIRPPTTETGTRGVKYKYHLHVKYRSLFINAETFNAFNLKQTILKTSKISFLYIQQNN